MIWNILLSVWERVVEEAGAIKKGTEWLIQDPRRGSQFLWATLHFITLGLMVWVAISVDRYKGLYYSSQAIADAFVIANNYDLNYDLVFTNEQVYDSIDIFLTPFYVSLKPNEYILSIWDIVGNLTLTRYFGAKAPDFYTSDSHQTQPDRQTNSTSSSSSTKTNWNSLTKPFTGSIGIDITSEKKLILLTSNEFRGSSIPGDLVFERFDSLDNYKDDHDPDDGAPKNWVGNTTDMVAVVMEIQLHKQDDNVFTQIRMAYERQGEQWVLSYKVKVASLRAFLIYPDEDVIKQASQTTAYLFRDNRSYRISAALIAVLTITVL
ncbi:hypothetical protein Pmani_000743 [Petrolisthes manimaculis]|uniref:Uncharacterized protein n=1 Tax=Petrolisthes manimaculis TaxID=1843537 RepID=A0AAE1QP82_9EUCA|nr:hypothetical protein Pmani_000743 [Petrolisthes manimaculis]